MDLPDTLTDRAAFRLRRAALRAERLDEFELAELTLPGRRYGLLALLENGPVPRQHELGAALGLDRTSTARMVRDLVDRGLVGRSPLPGNGRALVLELTAAGDALRAEAARRLALSDEEFLSPLGPDERTRLRTVLDRMIEGR